MWLFVTPVVYPSSLHRRALADALGDQPDGRRRRRLPLGDPRDRQRPLGPDRDLGRLGRWCILVAGLAYFDRVERGFADFV